MRKLRHGGPFPTRGPSLPRCLPTLLGGAPDMAVIRGLIRFGIGCRLFWEPPFVLQLASARLWGRAGVRVVLLRVSVHAGDSHVELRGDIFVQSRAPATNVSLSDAGEAVLMLRCMEFMGIAGVPRCPTLTAAANGVQSFAPTCCCSCTDPAR